MPTITPTFKKQGECGSTGDVYTCLRYGETSVSPTDHIGGSGDGSNYRNWILIRFDSLPSLFKTATLKVTFDSSDANDYWNADIAISHCAIENFTNSTTGTNRPTTYDYSDSTTVNVAGGSSSYTVDVAKHLKKAMLNGSKCLRLIAPADDNRKRIDTITLTYTTGSIKFNGNVVNNIRFRKSTSDDWKPVTGLKFNGTTVC